MKSFLSNIFKNKNLVTVIACAICFVIIIFAYRYRVNQQINPISVPYAKETIKARTEITEKMVGTHKIPASMVTDTVIRLKKDVVGKFVNYNTTIPAGSMFYQGSLVEWSKMPDSTWSNIPNGETVVSLPVNSSSTFGNSIYPGEKIDLYYKAYELSSGKLVFGKLIEGITVLAVKDESGNHIFKKTPNQRNASALIFSVSEELHLLLRKAMNLEGEIVPVPRNASYNEGTTISSSYLKNLILSQTVDVPVDIINNNTEPTNNTTNSTTNNTKSNK